MAAGQRSSSSRAMAGSTIASSRPWVTSIGTMRRGVHVHDIELTGAQRSRTVAARSCSRRARCSVSARVADAGCTRRGSGVWLRCSRAGRAAHVHDVLEQSRPDALVGGVRRMEAPTRAIAPIAVLAVRTQVVGDDERAVRPGHEHRAPRRDRLEDRRQVVGPHDRRRRTARPRPGRRTGRVRGRSNVMRWKRRRAFRHLMRPAQVALRPAVDEDDRLSVPAAPFADVSRVPSVLATMCAAIGSMGRSASGTWRDQWSWCLPPARLSLGGTYG